MKRGSLTKGRRQSGTFLREQYQTTSFFYVGGKYGRKTGCHNPRSDFFSLLVLVNQSGGLNVQMASGVDRRRRIPIASNFLASDFQLKLFWTEKNNILRPNSGAILQIRQLLFHTRRSMMQRIENKQKKIETKFCYLTNSVTFAFPKK